MKRTLTQNLGGGLVITTRGVHSFGTDAIVLADFASESSSEKLLELGTGCGIISLLLSKNKKIKKIHSVDIQEDAFLLCRENVEQNMLQNKINVFNIDLKNIPESDDFTKGSYDAVVMNPPYKRADDGVISPDISKAIARHEIACNIDDIVLCASLMLNTGGNLYLCHRPERLTDVIFSMRKHGIEPKRLRFVQQNYYSKPNLFLICGKKGASNGISIDASIFIEDENGEVSPEMKRIMGDYYSENKGR